MKKLFTSKVAGLWLMDLLKFEIFHRYFLLIPRGKAIFRASFNDYFCYYIENDLLDPYDVSNKLVEMEDRSRRNNLRFDGLVDNSKETWEECERKVQEVISNHLEIEHDVEIERCHRMGKRKGNRPCTIVCNFLRFKDKQKILQNAKKLKDTGIYAYEDFSNETMEVRKSLREKVLEYRRQGKYAYLNYRKIVVRDNS